MAFDLTFLRPADRRVAAMAFVAFALVGAGFGASALLHGGVGSPAPVPAPPAVTAFEPRQVTAEDIAVVRGELRQIQRESNTRFEVLDQRLSHLEGYVAGAEARK